VIDVSERAAELLAKADAAARRFNPDARIRVVPTDGGVRFVLSDGPEDGDVSVERDGVTFFADPTGTALEHAPRVRREGATIVTRAHGAGVGDD
jgi:hypothetical protein